MADLEARLSAKKRGLATNAKMLEQRGASLPDGGAKLRLAIDKIKVGCCSALGGYRDTRSIMIYIHLCYPILIYSLPKGGPCLAENLLCDTKTDN